MARHGRLARAHGPPLEKLAVGNRPSHLTPLNGTRAKGKPKGRFSKQMGAWEGALLAATSLAVENDVGLLDIPKLLEDLPAKKHLDFSHGGAL
jgi:hypothetical protein